MICSDLDPMQAPQWAVRIIMTEDPNCLLGNFMVLFFWYLIESKILFDLKKKTNYIYI